MPESTQVQLVPVPLRYELLQWAPGREVSVHKARRPATMGKNIMVTLAVGTMLFVALLVVTWGTSLTHMLGLSSVLLLPLGLLAMFYAGVDFAVSIGSGPRSVSIDWSARRLSEEARGQTTVHDLATLRTLELRRVEMTGESSPSSYRCELLAGFVASDGKARSAEILATDTADDVDSAYATLHALADPLAASLGVALTVKDERI